MYIQISVNYYNSANFSNIFLEFCILGFREKTDRNLIKNYLRLPLTILIAVAFYSCASVPTIIPNNFPLPTTANGFSKPRIVEGELTLKIKNIKVLKGDSLSKWNVEHNIPADQQPVLLLWSSEIKNHMNQRNVKNLSCSISPTDTFTENENSNTICFWKLNNMLNNTDSIILTRKFDYTDYDYRPDINKDSVAANWNKIPSRIKTFYTKSEPFLEQTPDIKQTSEKITEGIINPVEKAHAIFNWIRDTMQYVYPPPKRGAVAALHTLKGDCGQYSDLFIALARSAGIPARPQCGFIFLPDSNGYHVWSEIYLPVYGWVPVDATDPDGFCHIDNKKLIASVGENIPIKHAPLWATFNNSEVDSGKVDFMQLVSIVMSGIEADVSTKITVVKSVVK